MVQREEAEPEEEDPDKPAAQTFVQRHEDDAEHDS
jgi:hypothetical protein